MITPGTKLGAYEILAPLGKGGMGEVYRAKDTRLNREVAIKVLPADFSKDVGRLRRIEQEARATSALNHPNILTIHEIGEVDGTHYITMEFVDGQTLRERLLREPLLLDGSPPKQVTNFNDAKPERILTFDLSRDGKQLLIARGSQSADVVLISEVK
jgi:serine/threonine protein kinase